MTFNRHEAWEELISASLAGDLSSDERRRLDGHLETCAECRATLAAFADQRRIVSGLRHVPVPRDLDARVRAGIAGGSSAGLPWWRRPTAIFAGVGGGLAVVAGALLALVLLNGSPGDPEVGDASPTSSPAASPAGSERPIMPPESAPPSESTSGTPSPEPAPTATPVEASPEPDVYLALTGPYDNLALTVRDGATGDTLLEAATPAGAPIAAELSPGGRWLASVTELGPSGMNEISAINLADTDSAVGVGETVSLAQSTGGDAFAQPLSWAPDGTLLAFTVADPEDGSIDVWLFAPSAGEAWRLTDGADAYAGSWTMDESGAARVWVSLAGATPRSVLMSPTAPGADPVDPTASSESEATNVFQPLLSPNGAYVIFWSGTMRREGAGWIFDEGGAPWLAEVQSEDGLAFEFVNARQLFTDLSIRREGFASARVVWAPDSDRFAVWSTAWTATSQGRDGVRYPDPARVYSGRATDPRHVTQEHALDAGDVPEGSRVVDVKIAPTGRHLAITAARQRAGALEAPRADLLLVTRNTGSVADAVEIIRSADDGWFGPAAYDVGGTESP